jgi:hypothetical protein
MGTRWAGNACMRTCGFAMLDFHIRSLVL